MVQYVVNKRKHTNDTTAEAPTHHAENSNMGYHLPISMNTNSVHAEAIIEQKTSIARINNGLK
jgi:hypothetical protein